MNIEEHFLLTQVSPQCCVAGVAAKLFQIRPCKAADLGIICGILRPKRKRSIIIIAGGQSCTSVENG